MVKFNHYPWMSHWAITIHQPGIGSHRVDNFFPVGWKEFQEFEETAAGKNITNLMKSLEIGAWHTLNNDSC